MSTPAEIVAKARRRGNIDANDYPDADAIIDLNDAYEDFCGDIVTYIQEDYFWSPWVADTVTDQVEYLIEKIGTAPNDLNIIEIKKVFIKYNASDTYYTKCERVNPSSLEFDLDYYANEQSPATPFYYVQDNSIFVYPKPATGIVGGLKMNVIYQPKELLITDWEDDIKVPTRFHDLFAIYLKARIFEQQEKISEAQAADQEYETKKKQYIKQMSDRDRGAIEIKDIN